MASQNLVKRREIRKLEAKRDDIRDKQARLKQEMAQTRAALAQRRKSR